jgi:type 1 glutamine amidotransferase
MKPLVLVLLLLMGTVAPAANIVVLVVEDPNNYEAPATMRDFVEKSLKPLGHKVALIEGDNPQPHHFSGLIEALKDADLLVLFARRRFPPESQMAAIRAHLNSGKALLGIRTANHAFAPKPGEVAPPGHAVWPDFTLEVLGAPNTGYETKGLPYTATFAPGAENSPLLAGVNPGNILGHQSLYKVLPLADDATPLLLGHARVDASPAQPLAWTRFFGDKKARIFYTSLGALEDMRIADVRMLLLNAVQWTLAR